ncbi:MAG: RidA family protein [Planctomycetes bacterium]|nr:RidA family protein [Planctomycetota bacterium]
MNREKEREVVIPKNAAPLNVPLSPAVRYGNLLFVSGQVSTDVEQSKPIVGTIEEETEQALKNLSDLLKGAGSSLECVLKVRVFLRDMKDYSKMNEVYGRYFPKDPPARSTLGNIALAAQYKVEIEAVAFIPEK